MPTQVETLRAAAESAWDAYAHEMAQYSEENLPNEQQAAHVDELRHAATSAQVAVRNAETQSENLRIFTDQNEQMRQANNRPPLSAERAQREQFDRRSIGQRFVENPDYQSWLRTVAPTGLIPESAKGLHSPPLKFGGMTELDRLSALLTGVSDTSAGAFVTPQYYPGLTELGRRPLTIREVITNLQTSSDLVSYVRVTTETNAAAAVPEATAAAGGSGVKPESALAFERVDTPVVTIAHWIPATKRALSDAAGLRGLIDSFLRYGLDEELEDQIVAGTGGDGFTGILETAGTQAQAWDTNVFVTTRKARRKVRTVGRRIPTAYIMNPEDWETIELKVDNESRFFGDGPFGLTSPRLWGLPVIESEAVPVGTGLVGDFRTCVLWDREDSAISVSDSHSDFFIRNLVAILAEMRAAFGVLKPNALVEIDLTA